MLGYEVFAGKSPTAAATRQLAEMHRSQPDLPRHVFLRLAMMHLCQTGWRPDVADLPADIAEILTACWAQDPAKRVPMSVLLGHLQRLVLGESAAGGNC